MFHQGQDKWDEVPYVDLFFALRNDHETQVKCKSLDSDSNVTMMEDRDTDLCCSACTIGMLVAPDSGNSHRNNDRESDNFSLNKRGKSKHNKIL